MQTEIKRVIIAVDRKSYEIEQKNYIKKVKLEDAILKEVYHLLPDVKINETNLFKNVLSEFNTLIELAYKDKNTLRLTGSKLIQLLEINTSNLVLISNEYDKVKHFTPADIKDFSYYAENEEEINRFKLCKEVVNLCNKISKQHKIFGVTLASGFGNLIKFDMSTNDYTVNLGFIKNMRY